MAVRFAPVVLMLFSAGVALPADELFEKSIRPLLVEKCGACHNPKARTGGLDLTTPEGLRSADREVGLLQSDHPDRSRLMDVVRWEGKVKMPPSGKLERSELAVLEGWIRQGAPLPAESPAVAAPASEPASEKDKRLSHWSFQPVRKADPPAVRNASRVRNEIDRFIFAKLEQAGITLPEEAGKLTLLRRAKFDLHGLPPTPEEIHEFLDDTSPDAYERLIERLLASPRYGERWGRHWLDVARFAGTGGIDENIAYPEAWRYREYVIDSFNRDVPFDRFIAEQLAGDLLPAGDRNDYVRGRIATGFLALGPKAIVEQDKTKQLYDVIDEQIDTTSKAFLGLTISCARCHDHKFDPISTEDYYSLASIFRSTRLYEELEGRSSKIYFAPLVPDDVYAQYQKRQDEIAAKQLEIEALIEPEVTDYVYRELHPKLADYMLAAWAVEKEGVTLSEAARGRGLDAKILEKLARYLKSDGSFRPYLAKWHAAEAANVRTVAEEYATLIREPADRWRGILENWAREVRKAIANGEKPPPEVRFEGFAFTEESERFFGEISFLAKTFNEKDREDGAFAVPEKERKQLLTPATRERVEQLEKELAALKETAPRKPLVTHGVAEGEPFEQHVFVRGNHRNPGKPVAKRFPIVLAGHDQAPVVSGSGRLELARWLGSPSNPMTPRVAVNRIWLWHFGEGLVRTPDNFGLRGEAPTHPGLLDHLAARFVESGWSFKQMHRLIMNSSTYRFSSRIDSERWEKDPDNRLWSRFKRRRVSAEEMRDAWLAVDGSLDLRMGSYLDPVTGSRTDARKGRTKMDEHLRRTVYLPVDRNSLATMMVLFDFADSTTTVGQRGETYIAPQALY
ncbi:MAG: PSD1 and planctomycete cytochrome C domain-containing protein, partial [Bryobacteraceae bacterium]